MYLIVLSRLQLGMSSFVLRYMHIPCCRREECYVLDNIRNKDCGAQRALRTLPVGGLQQEQVFLSARYLLSKYTTLSMKRLSTKRLSTKHPFDQTSVDQTSVKQTSVNQMSVDQTSVDHTSVNETSCHDFIHMMS